jgi:hypothetical protein
VRREVGERGKIERVLYVEAVVQGLPFMKHVNNGKSASQNIIERFRCLSSLFD